MRGHGANQSPGAATTALSVLFVTTVTNESGASGRLDTGKATHST